MCISFLTPYWYSYILFLYLLIIVLLSILFFFPTFLAVYPNSLKLRNVLYNFLFILLPTSPPPKKKTWHSSFKKKFSMCISQFWLLLYVDDFQSTSNVHCLNRNLVLSRWFLEISTWQFLWLLKVNLKLNS